MHKVIDDSELAARLPEAGVVNPPRFVVLALLFVFSAQISHSQTSLENDFVKLQVQDGTVVSLFDKKRNAEHVASNGGPLSDMFGIELVKGVEVDSVIKASEMRSRVIREASDGFEIEYTHSKVQATIAVGIDSKTGESRWTIRVRPLDPLLAVGSVSYPIIDTPQHENGKAKRYLLPFYEGVFPLLTERPRQGFSYPSILFAQLIACIGEKSGFMLWTDDEKVNVKDFSYENRKTERSVFRVTHRMPYVTAQPWAQPYQTRLSLTGGSWYDAADTYRDWVTSVPMLGKKLRDRRNDANASIVHRAPISIQTALPVSAAECKSIPAMVKDWQEHVDALFVLRGTQWEKQWPWHSGPDFFPPVMGEKAFRDLARQLNELNVILINDVHGLIWAAGNHKYLRNFKQTTEEQIVRIAKELELYFVEHEGRRVCITERDGSLFSRQGNRYEICRGTEFGRSYLYRNAEKLFDLGATGFHSDLDIGPLPDGVDGCFNPAHGHPIPCGTWSYDVARQNFVDIKALAAKKGIRPFLLTKEHCTESLIPVLDAYLGRHSLVLEDPQVCHLAQYLYHEYIPTMLEGAGSFQKVAAEIIYGQLPGVPLKPPEDPDYLQVVKDYCHAMRGKGKEFLLYGRMRGPIIDGIPTIQGKMKPKQFIDFTDPKQKREAPTMEIPSVLHSVWEDGEGNIGVFAINTQKSETTVTVKAPAGGAWRATAYLGDSQTHAQTTAAGQAMVWRLPPGRLGSIVFTPVR